METETNTFKNLSENTIKIYEKHSKKYYKSNYEYQDPAKFYKQISNEKKPDGTPKKVTTLKTIMYAMLWKAQKQNNIGLYNKYYEFIEKNIKPKLTEEYEKTRNEKYKDIKTIDEYRQKYIDYCKANKDKGLTEYRYCVIGALYALHTPRRLMDYSKMSYVKTLKNATDKTKNYFVASNSTFIFNQYKTAGRYGQDKEKTSPELGKLLKEYIKKFSIQENSDTPMFGSERLIQNVIEKIYGEGVSINWLRHAQINKEFEKIPLTEIKESAKKMKHSVQTHMGYVTK